MLNSSHFDSLIKSFFNSARCFFFLADQYLMPGDHFISLGHHCNQTILVQYGVRLKELHVQYIISRERSNYQMHIFYSSFN